MATINPYLFVYGTLLMSGNKYGAYLHQHCVFFNQGKIKGLLYDIGDYPGAVASHNAGQYVYGSIYRMDEPEKILALLDEYEGISPDEPQPWEYIRTMVDVSTGDEMITCWVYWYNWTVDGLPLIPGGRYLD